VRQIDTIVCKILCSGDHVVAIVSPNDDGSYTIEDYFRGIDVYKADAAQWRKQVTQWRWEPDVASADATIAHGAHPGIVDHVLRGFTCTKSGCKARGYVLQNDLVDAVAPGNGRVTRLRFKSM
jgi:hypothetical protein